MNGYFMFKQRLTCKVLPPEKIHPELFKGANRKFRCGMIC
jgi:nucleolar protein 15